MANLKKFAVVLSGCGVFDGAEIHEATLSLYAISKMGCEYEIFAPDFNQHHVINHITGEEMNETRNVLIESARIARGKIKALSEFKALEFNGLLFPGGFGAAKNLSDWAFKGPEGDVIPEVKEAIIKALENKLAIGALCISPVLLAKVLKGVSLTIGSDEATVEGIKQTGARHKNTTHGEIVVDTKYKVVTTPCYMLDATIAQIGEGAEKVVRAMIDLMDD